jgi:hypothetical protein
MLRLVVLLAVLLAIDPARAEVLFTTNDGSVCETIYAPLFLNVAKAFSCHATDGPVATTCTSSTGLLRWTAYPIWADTLQPVGADRSRTVDMIIHCDIDYQLLPPPTP